LYLINKESDLSTAMILAERIAARENGNMLCVTHIWNETTNSAYFWGIPCFEMSKTWGAPRAARPQRRRNPPSGKSGKRSVCYRWLVYSGAM
ncbi:hypothetical protein, partial [Corynebacterium casei]|uniref:hypothetical protein n=1 Tax=Corynebacterium casei TaxID=160386 RepID=UPI003FD69512